MLEASIAPDERPAPTRVWISSMNRMISPALSTTSLTTPFRRSSNSPWYFAPAIKAPMSNEYTFLLLRFSGTSPSTIFWAMPSEMAVLPTPGSPTRIGLFLVLLLRICRTLRISSSLPMTGSSFPLAACSLRLTANLGKNCIDVLLFSIIILPFRPSGTPAPDDLTPVHKERYAKTVRPEDQTVRSQIMFQRPKADKMSVTRLKNPLRVPPAQDWPAEPELTGIQAARRCSRSYRSGQRLKR